MAAAFLLLVLAATPPADGEIQFDALGSGVWRHTAWKTLPKWGTFPSSGLIVRTGTAALLVDTTWDDAGTEVVLAWATAHGMPITHAVVTHAHQDKMGGVAALKKRGVRVWGLPRTAELAPSRGLEPPDQVLRLDTRGSGRLGRVDVYYPGAGHAVDNLVIYVPRERVLFGGCLVRPPGARTLGNTADGDVRHWAAAVAAAGARFPEARIIVPSHGPPAGRELLEHTIALAQEAARALE